MPETAGSIQANNPSESPVTLTYLGRVRGLHWGGNEFKLNHKVRVNQKSQEEGVFPDCLS